MKKIKNLKKIFIFLTLLIIGIFAFLIWWNNGEKPANIYDKKGKIFVIEKGQGVREVASNLKKADLIKDPVIFFLQVKRLGLDREIQAGDYRLSPSMDLNTLISELTHGTIDIWITVPEGLRAEEIANILKDNLKSYNDSWKDVLVQNNGYLFPDTYLVPKDTDINLIVTTMENTFYKKVKDQIGLDKNDNRLSKIVIVASLIEREAKYSDEKPLVASVVYNRIRKGMALNIDATVQYALSYQDKEKTWWKKNLTLDDLKTNSPYNTYVIAGLPPSPISNPGIESLKAAANPANTDYLYYVADKRGRSHFARTFAEHNENIRKYIVDAN